VSQTYDVIVLGAGGFGSAACYHLARRGVRVLGLEQFACAHDRGSSHGDTRIIRLAYFEHPDYVPLLRRAYELWAELEAVSQRPLFRRARLLIAGPPQGEAITGAMAAARLHDLTVQRLTAHDAGREFPGMRVPESYAAVLEPDAGFLFVEDCVRAHWQQAAAAGAVIHSGVTVREWSAEGTGVRVQTDVGDFHAGTLVITAGAWTGALLRDLQLPLTVVRKFVGWFRTEDRAYHVDDGYPTFYFEQPDGAFYGFPSLDGQSIKVAEHTGGDPITDPLAVDRTCRTSDLDRLAPFLQQALPRARPELLRHSVCLYTLTPDRHFLVDRHPQWPQVWFAAGFSGHGFKFTSVLGEALADLACTGQTAAPIGFLRLSRLGGNASAKLR
jgi:sarcosine oxidase